MEHTQELKEIIVECAIKYFDVRYPYYKNEGSKEFTFELYTDYRDVLDDSTIIEVLESHETVENAKYHLCDLLHEMNIDTLCNLEYEYASEVTEYILKNLDSETIEELKEYDMLEASNICDILLDNDVMSVVIDFDEIFARSELNMIISLENEVSIDHEFSLNNFDGDLLDWIENTQELLSEGDIEEKDFSLITLLKTQGYTFEEFKAYVERYYNDEKQDVDNFLESLINECDNTTSTCNALVFTTQVNLEDYLNETISISSISKNMFGGYVDFVYGGGSVLELKLKNDINLTTVEHEIFIDGDKYGYSINQIYGEFILY